MGRTFDMNLSRKPELIVHGHPLWQLWSEPIRPPTPPPEPQWSCNQGQQAETNQHTSVSCSLLAPRDANKDTPSDMHAASRILAVLALFSPIHLERGCPLKQSVPSGILRAHLSIRLRPGRVVAARPAVILSACHWLGLACV